MYMKHCTAVPLPMFQRNCPVVNRLYKAIPLVSENSRLLLFLQ